jgi:hypothetical protein
MIEGVDYCYIFPDNDKESVHVKLLSGQYEGVVYKYGRVGVMEENDTAYLQFNYDVIESPIEGIDADENFKNAIGDLLKQLMMRQLNNEGSIDEDGTDYFEEPNSQ